MGKVKDVLKSFMLRVKYPTTKVMNTNDTIDYILKNKCSIGRFGDGELCVMNGGGISFQNANAKLAEDLKKVKTTNKFLVCIPNVFNKKEFNLKKLTKEEYKFWKREVFLRKGFWNKYFSFNIQVGDAFLSRFYLRYLDKESTKLTLVQLKKLWDSRDIVFVEGAGSRLGVGNDLFDNAKSIKRIVGPMKHSFEKIEQLKAEMRKIGDKNTLFILALGPTATVLAYQMSEEFQCLDLGHIDIEYEWQKMGTLKKVPVPSKFVNEVEDGSGLSESEDKEYKSQIICKVE